MQTNTNLLTGLLSCHFEVPHEIFSLLLRHYVCHGCLRQGHWQETNVAAMLYFHAVQQPRSWQKLQTSIGPLARVTDFDNERQTIDTEGTHCDAKLRARSYSWHQVAGQFYAVRLAFYQLHNTPA